MLNLILGDSPRTTIAGYIGAIATGVLPILQGEGFVTDKIILAAAIAVIGRLASECKSV